jgi:hypothetical protein
MAARLNTIVAIAMLALYTLVPEVYFYYFHCEGERKNKPLVESGN